MRHPRKCPPPEAAGEEETSENGGSKQAATGRDGHSKPYWATALVLKGGNETNGTVPPQGQKQQQCGKVAKQPHRQGGKVYVSSDEQSAAK